MKSIILITMLAFIQMNGYVIASSVFTPASSASSGLATAINNYQKDNQGRMPQKWSDLDGKYISLEVVERELGGSIDQRFILLSSTTIEMISPGKNEIFNGGTILAVSSPITEDRRSEGLGRYVIWKTTDGKVRSSWLYEEAVKKQFAEANSKLPDGPVQVQPDVLDASPNYVIEKYARENFKDPKAPTPEELERMKAYMAEKYSDKRSPPPAPTPERSSANPNEPATHVKSPTPKALVQQNSTAEQSPNWTVIAGAVVAVLLGGGGFIWLLRKPSNS